MPEGETDEVRHTDWLDRARLRLMTERGYSRAVFLSMESALEQHASVTTVATGFPSGQGCRTITEGEIFLVN